MGDRQLLGTSQTPEIYQRDTDQLLQLQQSFLLVRMNNFASSSSISDIENVRLLSSGPSVEPCPHLSGGCFSHFPLINAQPIHSQKTIYGDRSDVNLTENGTCPKRKRSAASTVHDMVSGSQAQHLDINDINSSHKGKRLSISAQSSQRNVKSKHTSASQFNSRMGRVCFCGNLYHHFHATWDYPSTSTYTKWNNEIMPSTSHVGFPSLASGCVYHGMIQSHVGSSSDNGLVGNSSPYHYDPFMPIIWAPAQSNAGDNIIYIPNIPYIHGSVPSCSFYGSASTALTEIGSVSTEAVSRHSMPLSINGRTRSRKRNPRTRSTHSSSQLFLNGGNTHDRLIAEGSAALNQFSIRDPRYYVDLYQDMRLDIDNMSYEELLALEERIGNVNTGLSEDLISMCLKKTINCSSDDEGEGQHDGHCIICLESFEDREELGILRCGHDYHASCITNWLKIKNVCPICKCSTTDK